MGFNSAFKGLMLPGLFYDPSYPVHCVLPLTVLVSLSLAKTKDR